MHLNNKDDASRLPTTSRISKTAASPPLPRRLLSTLTAIGALSLSVSHVVQAQQVPPSLDPGQLLKQDAQRQIPDEPMPSKPAISPIDPAKPASRTDAGPLITVKVIRFDGLTGMSDAQAQALVAPALTQPIRFADLQALGDLVAERLRNDGFFLAQVVLPAQDITEGTVTFKVLEGRLTEGKDGIRVEGQSRLLQERVEGMLRDPLDKGLLRESALERGILLLNDLPGVSATVTVQPGSESETSSVQATLKNMPLLRGNFSLDTFGNRYTGAIRAGVNAYIDNPGRIGDQIALTGVKSLDGDSRFGRIGYTAPIGLSGLLIGGSVSYLDYKVGRDLSNLRSEGSAEVVSLTARYPIIRSRLSNLYLNAGADTKHLKSEVLGAPATDKDVSVLSVGLNGDTVDTFMGGGIFSGNVTVNEGKLNLDNLPAALAADAATFRTNGSYQRINYGLTRLQTLTKSTLLQVSFNAQHADRNLDTSEKLSLGGPLGVRAYAAGEALGDRGFVATAEVRTVIAKAVRFKGFTLGDIQLAGFYDEGRIQQFVSPTNTVTTPNHYGLSGAGFGLNMGDAGVYDFRLIVARKLGGNPGINRNNGTDSDGDKNIGRISALLNIYF